MPAGYSGNLDITVIQKNQNNLNRFTEPASESCSVCRDLITHMEQFFDMLETNRRIPASDWLTVDDIAKELKISKSIVYRLIRNGELKAINLVEKNGKIAQKGYYRIKRMSLEQYIDSKQVKPFPNKPTQKSHSRSFPKVKNYLGL